MNIENERKKAERGKTKKNDISTDISVHKNL